VTISAPTKAKITTTIPLSRLAAPSGAKPPPVVRFASPGESPEPSPNSQPAPIRMKAMIAATLIDANQNSNSP